MTYERSLDFIVETLKGARKRGKKCSLLIGAGCSASAGIPLAADFVRRIAEEYPLRYDRARQKNYAECMSELLEAERKDLLGPYIDQAGINWAHICIALLVKSGYVDRVLTTNFDPLVVRACALLGVFPAVYDVASSAKFNFDDVYDPSVFYLHGQRTGVVLLNTKDEFRAHSSRVGPVFDDSAHNRMWVVVGYSGENDPVFSHLCKISRFDNGLFWVGYQDNPPPRHVERELLAKKKNSFYTRGYDADSFFITVTQQLGLFPPDIVTHPFSHLDGILGVLTHFTLPGQKTAEDVTLLPRHFVKKAIQEYEPSLQVVLSSGVVEPSQAAAVIQQLVMKGDYEGALMLRRVHDKQPSAELAQSLSWAALSYADSLQRQAQKEKGAKAERLFRHAIARYEEAISLDPERVESFHHLGRVLKDLALITKDSREARGLFAAAVERYRYVLSLKDDPNVSFDMGFALLEQAKLEDAATAGEIFASAKSAFLVVEDSRPGLGAYNLACISALTGDDSACRSWLERSWDTKRLNVPLLAKDTDLDSVRSTSWFQAFEKKAIALTQAADKAAPAKQPNG